MTIQDLGALGELLGSVAVLVTLVYLTLQTRQNTAAIGAQVDAARLTASLYAGLTQATSSELQEVLAEDMIDPSTASEQRRIAYWRAAFYLFQWQFVQGRRGLLPTYQESGVAAGVRSFFSIFRSFEGWWAQSQASYVPEFIEWVEEQRAKAA